MLSRILCRLARGAGPHKFLAAGKQQAAARNYETQPQPLCKPARQFDSADAGRLQESPRQVYALILAGQR